MGDRNGGPAFPPQDRVLICDVRDPDAIKRVADALTRDVKTGMSLRDYFAGQALAGLCAAIGGDSGWSPGLFVHEDALAADAYAAADAMLKARESNG